MNTTLNVNMTTTVALADADRLIQLAAGLELSRMEQAELRAKYVALLPIATDEQFAVVRAAAASEGEVDEGHRVNVDFKLSAQQEQILRDVREARRKHLMDNRDTLMQGLLADRANHLVSMKVRVGTKKTTTTCRFERSTVKATGLLAQLREMTGLDS